MSIQCYIILKSTWNFAFLIIGCFKRKTENGPIVLADFVMSYVNVSGIWDYSRDRNAYSMNPQDR